MQPSLTDRALPERIPPWGVLVLESHHSPTFSMEWRTHRFIKIIYVLQGKAQFHAETRVLAANEGDVVLVPPGIRNRIEDVPNCATSLYICCVAKSLMNFDTELMKLMETVVLPSHGHFANRVSSRMRRMVHSQEQSGFTRSIALVADAMRLVQLVLERKAMRESSESSTDIDRELMQSYLDALPTCFYDETTIDRAAAGLGMSRRTFTKVFSEMTGETWLSRVRQLAIEHAQRKLAQTQLPIASVAFECGFNDLSSFYRQFRKRVGISPGKYRATHRNDE